MKAHKIYSLMFLVFCVHISFAQHNTKIGVEGGPIRFYPDDNGILFKLNHNNTMDSGWGWSAGIFFEKPWTSKFTQILEANFISLSSDIYLQKDIWENETMQTIIGNYENTKYNYLALSWGVKYFITRQLFFNPSFELARVLNDDVSINKILPNVQVGAGLETKRANIMLEYTYALEEQQRIFDISVPFAVNHRNKYLQLKIQVPVFNF